MEQSVVIKSKVEISRNLDGYSFPHKLSKDEAEIIKDKINNVLLNSNYDLILNKISELSAVELDTLLEKGLIDDEFISNEKGYIFINYDKTICILINSLDHIKIQILGYNGIKKIYDIANDIDDLLEQHLKYSFDKNLGYLTTCPINVGTGLKVTNIVHIPAIDKLNQVDDYHKIAHKIGVNFKGVYGKTKSILGNLYEISNNVTIGRSENNIIKSVESMSKDITKREYEARETMKSLMGIELEDIIFRALAILTNARVLTNIELMQHLSYVKLGIEMGYLDDVNLEKINKLMTGRQPYLKVISAYDEENKEERASYIRREFSLANRNSK